MNANQDNSPRMPSVDLTVDYGAPQPGSANPMPPARREEYQHRIKQVVEAQAAGTEKAAKLFIR